MVIGTKAIGIMIKKMDGACLQKKMELNLKDSGKMGKNMVTLKKLKERL